MNAPRFSVLVIALALSLLIAGGRAFAAQARSEDLTKPLTLEQCLRQALANNPDLSVRQRETAVQQLEKPLALSRFLPTLDVESTYTRFEDQQRTVPAHQNNQPGLFDQDHFLNELVLRLPLFQGGRRVAQYRIAELAALSANAQFTTSAQDLVLNVAGFFYGILQADQVIASTKSSIHALEVQKRTADLQVSVGRLAPLDAMKVEVRLASLEQLLLQLDAERQVLLAQLARSMGRDLEPSSPLQRQGRLEADLGELPEFEAGRAQARANRSELQQADADLGSARQALIAAEADIWPQLSSFARYGTESGWPYDQRTEPGALDGETRWAAGLMLDIPLFRGGATRTRVAQARLRVDQAGDKLRSATLLVDQQVTSAYAQLTNNRSRLAVTRKNVLLARETYRIEQAKYETGKSVINDVLDAQSAMLRAEVENSQALTDSILADLAWRRATGIDLIKHFHLEMGVSQPRPTETNQ